MRALVDELHGKIDAVVQGGGPKAIDRHVGRGSSDNNKLLFLAQAMSKALEQFFFFASGKLVARDRINELLDAGSPFLEMSQLAGHDLYGKEVVPAGGIITGIGRVNGYAEKRSLDDGLKWLRCCS